MTKDELRKEIEDIIIYAKEHYNDEPAWEVGYLLSLFVQTVREEKDKAYKQGVEAGLNKHKKIKKYRVLLASDAFREEG
jgi:hypothetical protein